MFLTLNPSRWSGCRGLDISDLKALLTLSCAWDINKSSVVIVSAREQSNPVPEPAPMFLLGFGIWGLGGLRRESKR